MLLVAACEPLFINYKPGDIRETHIAKTVREPRLPGEDPVSGSGSDYYFTAVSFPQGYDWRRDSSYGAVAASVRLYRNGVCTLEVPVGELCCADADMHHFISGHLYTQSRTAGRTVLARDGIEVLRIAGEEILEGLIPGGDKDYTLWQNKNGQGVVLRLGADTLLFRSRGTIVGSLREHSYLGTGALFDLYGQPAFCFRQDNDYYLARESSQNRFSLPDGVILDIRFVNGESCVFYQDDYGQSAKLNFEGYTRDFTRSGYRYARNGTIYPMGNKAVCLGAVKASSGGQEITCANFSPSEWEMIPGPGAMPLSLSNPRQYMGYSPDGRIYLYSKQSGMQYIQGKYYSFALSDGIICGGSTIVVLNPMENGDSPALWIDGETKEVEINGFISGVYNSSQ